jgi:glutathione S-transferase
MKLYSAGLSPFAARVRLAIYAKALPVDIVAPPEGGLKSPEYLTINPIGKLPALVLKDGTVIPESDTIVEFLADAFPASGLKPASAEEAARARLLARVAELYVMTPGGALFGQMNPKTRDAAAVAAAFENLEKGLEYLNLFMGEGAYATSESLNLADCAVVPIFYFIGVFGQAFGKGDLLARHGKLAAYWTKVQADPNVAKVVGEMQEGLAAFGRR